jgi:hypothetical protein
MGCYYIGNEDDFVPSSCYFRLKGERDDVWRRMSRPADYIARCFMYRNFGRHVSAVMRRPDWVFDNKPTDDKPDLDARLVDGLLCGQVIWDRFRSVYPPKLNEPEDFKYVVRTVDDCFEIAYRRPPGDRSAYFVSQQVWEPPEGWQDFSWMYKRNCPSWRRYAEQYDAEEDDRHYRYLIS